MRLQYILLTVCMAIMFTGCADTSQAVATTAVQSEPIQKEKEEPVNKENVLVNQIGYESGAQKLVIFKENYETNLFEVVNVQTDETVYRGTILQKEYNLKSDGFAAYGDFSKVTEAGEYYIDAGEYGISETFKISPNLYNELLEGQMTYFSQQNGKEPSEKDAVIKAADFMLSYLYFSQMFTSANEKQMPEILINTREKLEELIHSSQGDGTETAVLAMAVELYEPFDQEFSVECQTKAEEYFVGLQEEKVDDELYWAAAELYKLTGKREYLNVVNEYLKREEPKGFGKTAVGYYGTLAYLTTTYKTNVDQCTKLMEQLFDDAIEIVEQSSADGYKVSLQDTYQEDDAEILIQNARLLTLMNIISKSKDYVLGSGNHLDYLCGRNPFHICYLSEDNEVYQSESMIFILCGLADSYESEENIK